MTILNTIHMLLTNIIADVMYFFVYSFQIMDYALSYCIEVFQLSFLSTMLLLLAVSY